MLSFTGSKSKQVLIHLAIVEAVLQSFKRTKYSYIRHCCFGVLIFFFLFTNIIPEDTKDFILVVLGIFIHTNFINDVLFTKISLKQIITGFKVSVSYLDNTGPNTLVL